METSEKSRSVAAWLCLGLGLLGAHRFYTKRYVTAVLQLLTLGGAGVWAAVDLIFIACGSFADANGKILRNW
jgi:TM2 domain-containing membrane protein YozV